MIAHEAAVAAGLDRPGTCPWKRYSELHLDYGFLEPTGIERCSSASGKRQTEMRITAAGREYLRGLLDKDW
jgi:hypothetical protein